MNKALVVGGNSGIGRAIVFKLLSLGIDNIDIVDRQKFDYEKCPEEMIGLCKERTHEYLCNLNEEDYSVFDTIDDIDTLIITAGFGRVTLFENLGECEIEQLIKCNQLAAIQIVKKYYSRLKSNDNFNCAIMVSIAGHVASPVFSVYGSSKAGLSMFIQNINVELAAGGYKNRILDCSPGSINGTAFSGGENNYSELSHLAEEIVHRMQKKETLFIPQYEEVYKKVIDNYISNPESFGIDSYRYKMKSGRLSNKTTIVTGYLSGTFDLFHIGHLNLIRRAKQYCDYLIVGVHESGSWKGKETFIPFEERKEIVASCKYVNKVIDSFPEDSDVWKVWKYDKLFVGSDYKGTERFEKYEYYFKDKNVQIVYLPYTVTTSSTQLRQKILL